MQSGLSSAKQSTSKVVSKVGDALGSVSKPIQEFTEKVKPHVPDMGQREFAKKVGDTVDRIELSAAKSSDLYKYGGVSSKESRESIELSLKNRPKAKGFQERSDAGSSLVPVAESRHSRIWQRFKENNPASLLFSYIRRATEHSDNVLVHFGRELISSFTARVASVFSETETASVLKIAKQKRPDFVLHDFMKLLRGYIVPEILEAFIIGDLPSLRRWCSESAFKVLEATIEPSISQGCTIKGKILDIRDLDLVAAKLIDDRPVLVISFQVQQLFSIKNLKGEVIEGSEDHPENLQYIMAFTMSDSETNPSGWSLVEVAIRDKNSTW